MILFVVFGVEILELGRARHILHIYLIVGVNEGGCLPYCDGVRKDSFYQSCQ